VNFLWIKLGFLFCFVLFCFFGGSVVWTQASHLLGRYCLPLQPALSETFEYTGFKLSS
jgi:hypothetical protein